MRLGWFPSSPKVALALWLGVLLVVCGWPALHAVGACVRHLGDLEPPRWALLGSTLAWAAGIAALSTGLAWFVAWGSRGMRASWSAVVLAPLLLPMPLAYAGLNLFRAPGTAVGDWLALGPSWRAIAAGRAVAVLALALWAIPIASIPLALGVRRLDRSMLDAATSEGASALHMFRLKAAALRPNLLAAVALVAVIMTGSAIPLHLAQINTYAIVLWLEFDAAPDVQRVWLAAVPLLAPVLLASVAVAMWVTRSLGSDDPVLAPPPASRRSVTLALLIVAAASVLPLALLASELSTLRTFEVLWRTERGAIAQSALVAALVGLIAAAVCWCVRVSAAEHPRLIGVALVPAFMTALGPGVLVGSVIAQAWSWWPAVSDTPAVLVLAHLARFIALPSIAGAMIAASENSPSRDARRVDGASGLFGTLRASSDGLMALAVGCVVAAMSLGEIEASIIVQPPGAESVARSMLNMLHFARYEHLSGLILLVALPAAGIGGIAWILRASARTVHPPRAST